MNKRKNSIKIMIIALILSMALFCGCENEKGGIDKTKIFISCGVFPGDADQLEYEPNIYNAGCVITNSLDMDFSDTFISINNTQISNQNSAMYETNEKVGFYSHGVGVYHAGDIVELSISNSLLGDIRVQAIIPEYPPEFIITPDFPGEGIENLSDTYSVSWEPVENVNSYMVSMEAFYDGSVDSARIVRSDFIISDTTYNIGINDPDHEGEIYKWLGIGLSNVNESPISGYGDGSCLWVAGSENKRFNF